jgi:protein phosphatase 1 regulatory subunit 32
MERPLPRMEPALQLGKASAHVLQSSGADPDIYNFYCTQNSTTYGIKGYVPREGKHVGSGYQSNLRPQYAYNRQLDEFDNPTMSRLLADNYDSVTKKSYRPSSVPNGREPLPCLMPKDNVGTGFTNDPPVTHPTMAKVYEPYMRPLNAGVNPLPKFQPHLHRIQSKEPVEAKNHGHGPGYMETETGVNYTNKNNEPRDMFDKATGALCGSGFTSNKNIEPVTFHQDMAYKDPSYNDRPVGDTEYNDRFLHRLLPSGAEPLPHSLPAGSCADTGFTREPDKPGYEPRDKFLTYSGLQQLPALAANNLAKQDPAAYLNATHPDNRTGLYPHHYQGKQVLQPSQAATLARQTTGNKTETGYSENTTLLAGDALQHTVPDDKRRFLTHNHLQYYDKNPAGEMRQGRVIGAVQPHREDGFTKSEKLHTGQGPAWDASALIYNNDPYQSRSVKARDPFFDDHKHDAASNTFFPPSLDKDTALVPSSNYQKPRLEPYQHNPNYTGVKVGTPRQRHTQHWAAASGPQMLPA